MSFSSVKCPQALMYEHDLVYALIGAWSHGGKLIMGLKAAIAEDG